MLTKKLFLTEYREGLANNPEYDWALNAARLDKFMASVAHTLNGGGTWNKDSLVARAIWKRHGYLAKDYTYKNLQALPE